MSDYKLIKRFFHSIRVGTAKRDGYRKNNLAFYIVLQMMTIGSYQNILLFCTEKRKYRKQTNSICNIYS